MHCMREQEGAVVIGRRVDAGFIEGSGEEVRIDLVIVRVAQTDGCSEFFSELEIRLAIGGHAPVPQAGDAEGRRIAVWIRDVVPVVACRRPGGWQNSGSNRMG